MTLQLHYTGTNNSAYLDALEIAERRAPHSYFNQHIIAERDDRFIAIDEGDEQAVADRQQHRQQALVLGDALAQLADRDGLFIAL